MSVTSAAIFAANQNKYGKDVDLDEEVVEALNHNRMKVKGGDLVAKRIQEGVRSDILVKYKDKKSSKFIKNIVKNKNFKSNLFI